MPQPKRPSYQPHPSVNEDLLDGLSTWTKRQLIEMDDAFTAAVRRALLQERKRAPQQMTPSRSDVA